ncbi:MAG: hypothetical protein MK066_11420 [Crocinitomicaceae bacterium]|nr:hypothetical protein [Crocinitomicaceae bacterium]
MKTTIITSLLIGFTGISYSQTEIQIPRKHIKSGIQINGIYSSFQDTKYSNVSYNGYGTGLELIHSIDRGSNRMEFGLRFNYSNSKPSTFSVNEELIGTELKKIGTAKEFRPTIYGRYTQKLNEHFAVGGKLDALDATFRITNGLGNNSVYYNNGHNLLASGRYDRSLSSKLHLSVTVDLGIISWMRESTGFAFSTPQSVVAEGAFNYQDKAVNNPFGYRFFEMLPIWKYGNLSVTSEINYSKRWVFSYTWNLRRFSTVKEYPTTIGLHTIGARFNFRNKLKQKRK